MNSESFRKRIETIFRVTEKFECHKVMFKFKEVRERSCFNEEIYIRRKFIISDLGKPVGSIREPSVKSKREGRDT